MNVDGTVAILNSFPLFVYEYLEAPLVPPA